MIGAPVGFVSDQVEILYDIDIQAQHTAKTLGIRLERPPALNEDPLFISALASLIQDCVYKKDWHQYRSSVKGERNPKGVKSSAVSLLPVVKHFWG